MGLSSDLGRRLGVQESLEKSPRFGNTAQFSDLFSNDDEAQSEYIRGIVATSILICSFFLAWAMIMCIFKCCLGKRRVGFLSGSPYDATTLKGEPNKRAVRGRMVFGFSGLMFIVFTLLLIFLGIANLEDTTRELSDGAEVAREMFDNSQRTLVAFLTLANKTAANRDEIFYTLRETFEVELDNDSPYGGGGGGDGGSDNTTTTNSANTGATVSADKFIFDGVDTRERVRTALQKLQQLDTLIVDPANEMQSTLDDGATKSENVRDGLRDIELNKLQTGIAVPLIVVATILIGIMGLSTFGISNKASVCCTAWFMTPLFAFILFILLLFTMAMSVGGIVNADFCTGGDAATPEATLVSIMEKKGIDPNSFKFVAVEYLVHGCEFETPRDYQPLAIVEDFKATVNNTQADIKDLLEEFDRIGIDVMTRRLNYNMTVVQEILENVRDGLDGIFDDIKEFLTSLICSKLYEVYVQVIDDATCTESYFGLAWTYSSLLIITFFGFLMLQFRAAMYPLAGLKDDDDYSWNAAKEKEMASGDGEGEGEGQPEGPPVEYIQDEGLQSKNNIEDEPAMGGTAQQRYDAVGDDNPFAEVSGQDNFQPRQSPWG